MPKLLSIILLSLASLAQVEQGAVYKLTSPPAALIHGTYPGGYTSGEDDITLAQVIAYERSVDKRVAWVYFSHYWFQGRTFSTQVVNLITRHGSTPFVRLMMRTHTIEQYGKPIYKFMRISRGDLDAKVAQVFEITFLKHV